MLVPDRVAYIGITLTSGHPSFKTNGISINPAPCAIHCYTKAFCNPTVEPGRSESKVRRKTQNNRLISTSTRLEISSTASTLVVGVDLRDYHDYCCYYFVIMDRYDAGIRSRWKPSFTSSSVRAFMTWFRLRTALPICTGKLIILIMYTSASHVTRHYWLVSCVRYW